MLGADDVAAIEKFIADVSPILLGPMLGEKRPLGRDLQPDTTLQTALDSVLTGELAYHSFAVVDLTDETAPPKYAGHLDRRQQFIASLAKLLPLYGAHRLRADVRQVSFMFSETDLGALASLTRQAYQRAGAATDTRPRIEEIFAVDADGHIDFTSSTRTDSDLAALHSQESVRRSRVVVGKRGFLGDDTQLDFELQQLPFRDHLRLMTGWSDNTAAGTVIQALGFDLLWALAQRSGLSQRWPAMPHDGDPGRIAGGLFVSGDYCWSGWRTPKDAAPFGQSSRGGNARSIATLLIELARDGLVGPESDAGMREMLRKEKDDLSFEAGVTRRIEWSPIGKGMASQGFTSLQPAWDFLSALPQDRHLAFSKVGYLDSGTNMCDAVVCRTEKPTTAGGTTWVTFAVVGLCNQRTGGPLVGPSLLQGFGEQLALQLKTIHDIA